MAPIRTHGSLGGFVSCSLVPPFDCSAHQCPRATLLMKVHKWWTDSSAAGLITHKQSIKSPENNTLTLCSQPPAKTLGCLLLRLDWRLHWLLKVIKKIRPTQNALDSKRWSQHLAKAVTTPLGELATPFVTSQWAIHRVQEPTSFPQPYVNARQKVCLRLFQGLQHLAESGGTRATFPDLFVLAKTSR